MRGKTCSRKVRNVYLYWLDLPFARTVIIVLWISWRAVWSYRVVMSYASCSQMNLLTGRAQVFPLSVFSIIWTISLASDVSFVA